MDLKPVDRFDVIVVGAGPAGEVVAARLGAAGLAVALVEQEYVGGECSFYACMPSKALLRPAELVAEAGRVGGVDGAHVDVPGTLSRRDEVIHHFDDSGYVSGLEARGVELLRGRGLVVGERLVEVGGRRLEAGRAVVLATGSAAEIPPIEGLAEAAFWTNREATVATAVPQSLLVLGGGVVGAELAQAWRTLGAQVTIVEALDRLLAREEPFASEQVADALRARGVEVRLGSKVVRAGRGELELEDGTTLRAAELLVAIGRRPLTEAVESLGFEPGEPIETDEHLRTRRHPWLYAIGDVNGRALVTHMGKYQARIAADHILGGSARVDPLSDGPLSPRVVFTDPHVAAVGHTLQSALDADLRVEAYDAGTSENAGGSFYGREAPGTARIVVDRDRGVLVGATITGAQTAEMLHAATIAIVGEVPVERLWHAVPAFPTRSELWVRLLERMGL